MTALHAPAPAAADGDTCPKCDAQLVNVQGLRDCRDCAWTGGR